MVAGQGKPTRLGQKAKASLTASTPVRFIKDREQRVVNLLALATLIVTVLVRVIFATAKPWFSRGGEVAALIADLGVGYLAAWFFYYLVSWRPAYRTKQRVAIIVSRQTFGAVAHASQLRDMLRGSSDSTETGPMTKDGLAWICDELHVLAPSTDVNVADPSVRVSVLRSIWRHVEMVLADVEPIIRMSGLFDGDIVADAAALSTSALTAMVRSIVGLEPNLEPPGPPLVVIRDSLWEFMDMAERLWLTMVERYPESASTVGPAVMADHASGRSRVLAR